MAKHRSGGTEAIGSRSLSLGYGPEACHIAHCHGQRQAEEEAAFIIACLLHRYLVKLRRPHRAASTESEQEQTPEQRSNISCLRRKQGQSRPVGRNSVGSARMDRRLLRTGPKAGTSEPSD